jgi:hypothetical protein
MWKAAVCVAAIASPPALAQPSQPTCVMTTEERTWVDGALGASAYMMEQRLRLSPVPHPTIIVFNERCRFELKEGSRHWSGEGHAGKIRLVRGGAFPAGIVAMADYDKASGERFMLIALPSIWRKAGVIGPDETGPTGVFLHEYAHTRDTVALRGLYEAAERKFKPPEYFNDDSLQERLKGDPAYVAVWEKEADLLYRAAAEPDDAKARALARQALDLMEARQKRWFTDSDAMWKPFDDLFLTSEGFGQWVAYAWLADPKGGGMAPEAAREKMRGKRRQWSQEEGLGLFLVIDRLVPHWSIKMFGSPPKLGIDLLRQAVSEAPTGQTALKPAA